MDYGSIFFKDKAPLGFGEDWDQDWEKVPFPVVTYTLFLTFVISVTFIAFNVLVGLTVDDIRNILNNADTRTRIMKNDFLCRIEQTPPWIQTKKKRPLDTTISKKTQFGAMIWNEIEKRHLEYTKKGKLEDEMNRMQSEMNEMKSKNNELKEMLVNTNTMIADIKRSLRD